MPDTPDARPVGETRHPDAALIDAVAMQIDADLFVGRSPVDIARSTVAAIRAALLRDAPVVWVARDGGGLRLFTEKPRDSHATFVDAIIFIAETRAFGLPDSIADALGLALGECVRVLITREEA